MLAAFHAVFMVILAGGLYFSTNLVKEGDYGEKELEDVGFWCLHMVFDSFFETNSDIKVKTSLICSWAVRARTAHDFHEIQVGGSNPFDSIRFKMGIFPKQTETTTKHAFKSKKHPDIFWR